MKRANVMEIAMDVVPKRNAGRKVVDQAHNTARKEVVDWAHNTVRTEGADRKDVDPVPNADQKEVTDRKVVDPVHNAGLKGVDRRTSEVLSLEDPVGVALEDVSLG